MQRPAPSAPAPSRARLRVAAISRVVGCGVAAAATVLVSSWTSRAFAQPNAAMTAPSPTSTPTPAPTPAAAPTPADPTTAAPIDWARWLVANVRPENNAYASSPSYVVFPSDDGAVPAEARTMCNSFFASMLSKAYGFNENYFRAWTGGRAPTAARWFATAQAGRQFTKVAKVTDVKPGDVLLIDYGDGSTTSTGHIALIDSVPQIRFPQSAPFVPDTIQYEVGVIDSARTGHGPYDSRRMPDGSWVPGVGRGTMRLYVSNLGAVVGYAWSTWTSSSYAVNGLGPSQTLLVRLGFP